MVVLTDRAATEVKNLLEEQGKAEAALRLYVAGGGCSGLQYGLAIEDSPEEDDFTFESNGVNVVVDPMSHTYVDGASIDFIETMMGGGFKVDNPRAVKSCGCGSSFSTEDSPAAASSGCGSGGCGSH